jgi:hypothetical protein
MESSCVSSIIKLNTSFEQKCSIEIKENSLEYRLIFGISGSESIYFVLYDLKDENFKYMNISSLSSLKLINFWFNQFSSVEKLTRVIKNLMNSNNFKIKEGNNGAKTIYFLNPIDKEDIISIELNKKEKTEKEIIRNLLKTIIELKEKNAFLENKINDLENKYDKNIQMLGKQIDDMRKKMEESKPINNNSIKMIGKQMDYIRKKMEEPIPINNNSIKMDHSMDSLIISKEDDINLLKEWIFPKKNISFQLIYRATRDGDTKKDFHRMCDDKSPTIFIFKTPKNFIFGGYTTVPSNISNNKEELIKDEKAFVFSLNQRKKNMTKEVEHSIYKDNYHLIIFGNGNNSIQINNNILKNKKHWNNPKGSYGDIILTENKEFSIVEMEVFQVKFT